MNKKNLTKNVATLLALGMVFTACGGGGSGDVNKVSKPLYTLSDNGNYIYEDAEDNTTNDWVMYINDGVDEPSISNVTDEETMSKAIEILMNGREAGYIMGAPSGEPNAWNNDDSTKIKWDMKVNDAYTIYIRVNTTRGKRVIYYTAQELDGNPASDTKFFHPLGVDSLDGQWHTYTRDLLQDLKDHEPNNEILTINAFTVRGSGRFDNIILIKKD